MKENSLKVISVYLIAMLVFGMIMAFPAAYAQIATISVLNPDDTYDLAHVDRTYWTASHTYDTKKDLTPAGPGDIIFHADTHAGDIFYIRVYLGAVTNLWNWQIKLYFNASLLQCTKAFIPADSPFKFAVTPTPVIDNTTGYVMMGSSRLGGEPGVSGSGDLAWIVFEVAQGVGYEEYYSCDFTFDAVDTFLLDPDMADIPFTSEPGHYEIFWAPPEIYPYYMVYPAEYKARVLGQDVQIDILVKNVDPAWEIIGFQFALRFNATLLEPVNYTEGTFMENFTNNGESVIYASAFDYMGDAALPPGYNAWTVGVIIMPGDGNVWHAPFPEGEGLLVSLHFTAIYETISPEEAWTDLSFTSLEGNPLDPNDNFYGYALNQHMDEIPLGTCIGGNYRAPMRVLGLSLDLYSQYPRPYGGQDFNMPSDSFAPQVQVELYALVKYNDDPVQQKLVAFEVRHGEFYIYREATTNDIGIAHVSFRIPWPCDNPEGRVLGEWIARATVEVAEKVANDTMPFKVWWPVEITSIEPKVTKFIKRKPLVNDPLEFVMEFRTYRMQPVPVYLTVVVYDELGFVIGHDVYYIGEFGWGEYGHYCEFRTDTWIISIPMPSHAVVGKGTVYGNAYNNLPWNNGTPYCPEKTNTIDFYIKRP
ncbi:MAG: hypothetical protein QME50_00045 [Candidatus Bathyarchaeota archaeon]|nr:hypothetical protein [Candidatus Bathyarchaeota archaeon]